MLKELIIAGLTLSLASACQPEEEKKQRTAKGAQHSSDDEVKAAQTDHLESTSDSSNTSNKNNAATKDSKTDIEQALFTMGLQSLVDGKGNSANGNLAEMLSNLIANSGGIDKLLAMLSGFKEKLLTKYDANDDKKIDLDEFQALLDDSGSISSAKFDKLFEEQCADPSAKNEKLCAKVITKFDQDDDGKLDADEIEAAKSKLSSLDSSKEPIIELLAFNICQTNKTLCTQDLLDKLKNSSGTGDLLSNLQEILAKKK